MSKPTLVELRTAAGPLPRVVRRRDPDDGLRALLRAHLQQLMWTTIETGAVAGGVADCNWLAPGGREGWIECKATRASAVRFRPGQVGWLLRRARMGGSVHVAVRRRSAGSTRLQGRDELWLVHGSAAPRVAELGLRADVPWFVTAGGPDRWDWYHVLHLLTAVRRGSPPA